MDNALIRKVKQVKRMDAQRPNIPGEHWAAFLGGLGLWLATRKNPSTAVRLIAGIAGGLLVARAASGRDVPRPMRRWMPHAN